MTKNAQPQNWNGLPGPTWVNLTQNEASLSISDLEFDPSTLGNAATETIVAGIGTTSSFGRVGGKLLGLLFSKNGGSTWQTENADGALLNRQVSAVSPLANEVLVGVDDGTASVGLGLARVSLVGPDPNPFIPAFNFRIGGGLFLSQTGRVTDLLFGPTSSGQIGDTFTNRVLLSLHRSNDLGTNQNRLFVGIVNNKSIAGLFRGDIDTNTWQPIKIPSVSEGKHGDLHFSVVSHPTLSHVLYVGGDIDKATGNANIVRILVGQASDGSDLIQPMTFKTNSPHPDSRSLKFNSAGNLFEADDGGVFMFAEPSFPIIAEKNWISLNRNLGTTEVTSVAFDPINLGVVVGTQDNGTASTSDGKTFSQLLGGDGIAVHVDVRSPRVSEVYYSAQFLNPLVRRTEIRNAGGTPNETIETALLKIQGTNGTFGQSKLTVQAANSKVGFDSTLGFAPPIAFNTVKLGEIVVGSKFLYESSDRSDAFRVEGGVEPAIADTIDNDSDGIVDEADEIRPKTPLEGKGTASSSITAIAAIAAGGIINGVGDANLLYVGFASGNVFVREIRNVPTIGTIAMPGESLGAKNGRQAILEIKVDPTNGRTAYAVTAQQIFRTDNYGQTWTEISGNFATLGATISSIALVKTPFITAVVPREGSDRLFLGTSDGVFSTVVADMAVTTGIFNHTWVRAGVDLPHVPIQDLEYDISSDKLIAGTLGRGVFVIPNVTRVFDFQRMVTGDVAVISLPKSEPGSIALTGVDLITKPGVVTTLDIQHHPLRGDFEVFLNGQIVGELAFSERFDSNVKVPFSQSGQFIFAPNSVSNFLFDDRPDVSGFQGVVRFRYTVGAISKKFDVEVANGTPTIVDFTRTGDLLSVMQLQQRLNFHNATDANGQILAVDGIIGPLTEQAIRKFKAQVTPENSTVIDSFTSSRLNKDPVRPLFLSAITQTEFRSALNELGTKLDGLNRLHALNQPLSIVGSQNQVQIATDPSKKASIANSLLPGTLLRDNVLQPIADYLVLDPTPSPQEFSEFILAHPEFSGLTNVTFDIQTSQIRIGLHVDKSIVTSHQLDLGDNALNAGLSLDQPPRIDLTTTLTANLILGIDLNRSDIKEAGFLEITNLATHVFATTNTPVNVKSGFVNLNAKLATFGIDGNVQVSTNDPAGDGAG